MEKEVWVDIVRYEGLYQVSNLGRVKAVVNETHKVEKILEPRIHSGGYLRVSLSKNGKEKDFYIHRLVGEAFLPNPNNLKEINHINGYKTLNHVTNLEWCDRQQNARHAVYVLGGNNVKKVECIETGNIYPSVSEAARSMNGDPSGLCAHLRGRHKTFHGFHWRYADTEKS